MHGVISIIPGNDLAVPCAVDLDKTLHWISDWGNQAYWAVNVKELLVFRNRKLEPEHLQVVHHNSKLETLK